jgi:hypothetical protein
MDWARILAYVTGTVDQEARSASGISGRALVYRSFGAIRVGHISLIDSILLKAPSFPAARIAAF